MPGFPDLTDRLLNDLLLYLGNPASAPEPLPTADSEPPPPPAGVPSPPPARRAVTSNSLLEKSKVAACRQLRPPWTTMID